MGGVLACIDGSVYSPSVADHAAWAAGRVGGPVTLLQVLGRRLAAPARLLTEARRALAEEMAAVEAERARLMRLQAQLDLEEARTRVEAAGIAEVSAQAREGDLLEEIAARECAACLTVIGKRGAAADFARDHLGSNLERIVRASARPVLIAARAFRPIRRLALAFDGRASAQKAVDAASRSPLFAGLTLDLVMVGAGAGEPRARLDAAVEQLRAAGVAATARIEPGQPESALPAVVAGEGFDLLIMGAYGHSRLRSLMIGSTTSEVIRACRTPILLYR